MRRIGDSLPLTTCLGLLLAGSARAEVELSQAVDRHQVGTEDTFRLTVVLSGAPEDARLELPSSEDFEVLSRSQSTQMSFQMGGGGSHVQRVQKYVLVMRANRTGTLTIPPAVLKTSGERHQSEAIEMEVKKGRLHDSAPPRQRPLPDPFGGFPFPQLPDPFEDLDEGLGLPDQEIPRSDSDLFLRSHLDKEEVFLGEQATLSIYIYSRMDLSSVDTVTMPKLDGFWSEDIESPSQLSAEQQEIRGVPYRVYLLKRRALFPMKPGTTTVQPAEADITTGFLFAGRRTHRVGNQLELKVRALPPGAPPDYSAGNVGHWRLSTQVSQTEVKLGEPVTVKVLLEGRGNLKNLTPPRLIGPPALKIYEPTSTDKLSSTKSQLGGRRTQEYLVMPQQTGTFVLPGLAFTFFNPERGQYQESSTDPVTLTVLPGAQGAGAIALGGRPPAGNGAAKNQLEPAGLKPLRYRASFQAPRPPLWSREFFLPLALAPLGMWLMASLLGLVRGAVTREDEASRKRKQARAARARLSQAEKLKQKGQADQFYGEVEKALLHFLEAKLGLPVKGLTRPELSARLQTAGVAEQRRAMVLAVLEACETGRFAPGGEGASRGQVLDHAQAAMEGWAAR